jgi:hypothetical protein
MRKYIVVSALGLGVLFVWLRTLYNTHYAQKLSTATELTNPNNLQVSSLYTFRDRRPIQSHDRENVEFKSSDTTEGVISIAGQNESTTSETTIDAAYLAEYLGDSVSPDSKQYLTFTRASSTKNGTVIPLNLGGKSLIVEARDSGTGFRMASGNDVVDPELSFLTSILGTSTGNVSSKVPVPGVASNGGLIGAFWPRKAVRLGENWSCDTDGLAKRLLSAYDGITIVPDQSRGQSQLVKVYLVDGVTYAKLKVKATLAIGRISMKDLDVTFDLPAVAQFDGFYDVCIDGSTNNMTADVKFNLRGEGHIKSGDQYGTATFDSNSWEYDKYTLLRK